MDRPADDQAGADDVERSAWQIGEIEAGLAELDAGEGIDEAEAERRFARLLRHRGSGGDAAAA